MRKGPTKAPRTQPPLGRQGSLWTNQPTSQDNFRRIAHPPRPRLRRPRRAAQAPEAVGGPRTANTRGKIGNGTFRRRRKNLRSTGQTRMRGLGSGRPPTPDRSTTEGAGTRDPRGISGTGPRVAPNRQVPREVCTAGGPKQERARTGCAGKRRAGNQNTIEEADRERLDVSVSGL